MEEAVSDGDRDAGKVCGACRDEHGARFPTDLTCALASFDKCLADERECRSTEERRRALGAQLLAARGRVDRDIAKRRELQVIHEDERYSLPQAALERDVEDVAVEHDGGEGRSSIHHRFDAIRGIPRSCGNRVAAIEHTLSQRQVSFRQEEDHVDVRPKGVAESEHPLEMSQSHATAAIGAEQRPGGRHRVARAAAHACIRCRARTTSSWSEAVIAG